MFKTISRRQILDIKTESICVEMTGTNTVQVWHETKLKVQDDCAFIWQQFIMSVKLFLMRTVQMSTVRDHINKTATKVWFVCIKSRAFIQC